MRFAFKREMLPSFESQKTVTEKTTKGEAQAYSPLESPFVYAPRTMHTAAQGALLFNRRGDYQSPAYNTLNYILSLLILLYFLFVARPPRICLCALFSSSTSLTSLQSRGFITANLFVTSLCTVDLLIPKTIAAWRTVAFVSTI